MIWTRVSALDKAQYAYTKGVGTETELCQMQNVLEEMSEQHQKMYDMSSILLRPLIRPAKTLFEWPSSAWQSRTIL